MTHQKRKSNDDNNTIMLNKDVLSIIGSYVRPKLWLYWIYNSNVGLDEIKCSHVIEADSYKNACIEIFNKHADHLLKEEMIVFTSDVDGRIKEGEKLVTNDGLYLCTAQNCKRKVTFQKFCPDHFPSLDTILKYVNDNTGKYDVVHSLNNCPWRNRLVLKIKELEW